MTGPTRAAFGRGRSSALAAQIRHTEPPDQGLAPDPAAFPGASPADLFVALDGRHVAGAGHRWRVEVFSVCDRRGRRWIQLALKGRPRYMLTLRLIAGAGLDHVMLALSSWIANPCDTNEILNVA